MLLRNRVRAAVTLGVALVLAACAGSGGGRGTASGTTSGVNGGGTATTLSGASAGSPAGAAGGSYRVIVEPNDGFAWLYDYLMSPVSRLDLSMYELVDTRAEQALVADVARHVTVRVVLDRNREGRPNQAAYDYLAAHGVQVRWAPNGFLADHEKAIVVDGTSAAVLTLNLTSRYYANTRDFAVMDTDVGDVAEIERVFSADFGGSALRPPSPVGAVVWSPGAEATMAGLVSAARTSVTLENEEMSDPAVIAALMADARRGVQVTVTMTYASEWVSAFHQLTAAGVEIHLFHGETPLYVHAKALVVDAARVLVGSQNDTAASLNSNRELGLVLAVPGVVGGLSAVLQRDFAAAAAWT